MFDPATVFLFVDDNYLMHKVTNDQLMSLGAISILSAYNGLEALNILEIEHVDIIISDWNMPIMSGLDLLKIIRASKRLNHLPFIMITGESNFDSVREAIDNGVTSFLIKPYTLNNFTASLEKAYLFKSRHLGHSDFATNAGQAQAIRAMHAIAPQSNPINQDGGDSDALTILIMDDMLDDTTPLSSLFKDSYRVLLAQAGKQAVAICHSDTPPDLVLIHVRMPDINGFNLILKIRQNPICENIPFIFITSRSDVANRIKNQGKDLNLGTVDYVMKPVEPAILKLRVRNLMRAITVHKQVQKKYDALFAMTKLRENIEHATSHDLRNPLTSLLGMVQMLIDQDSFMNPEQIQQLQVIERISLDILDMLVLSSKILEIETGSFKLQTSSIDVASMLERIVNVVKAVYRVKKLLIQVHADLPEGAVMLHAVGDAALCYAMLDNLLRNSCESAPACSSVKVTLSSEGGLNIIIRIARTGTVPLDIRPVFFEKFVPGRKGNGSGLQTYYAQLMAQAQNGSVDLDVSDLENQTKVTVTLPC